VAPLPDSTAVEHDAARLRARLGVDGFVFLRGLVDRGAARDVGIAMLRYAQRLGHLGPGDPLAATPTPRPPRPGPSRPDQVWVDLLRLEGLHRLAHDERLSRLAERILGEPAICVPRKRPRFVWPGLSSRGRIHQDYPLLQQPDMLTAWIALRDIPQARGGLCVFPGSQVGGPFPIGRRSPFDPRSPRWATADFEPGDVVVFHCMTAHYARANRTHQPRVSLDVRFVRRSDPVNEELLLPDGHRTSPAELTEGWSSTEWVAVPPDVVARPPVPGRPHGPSSLIRIPPAADWSCVGIRSDEHR
jgi:hypothetical protein